MRKFFRKIALLFMVCGLAVSGVSAKCKDANGKIWDSTTAKEYMELEWNKEKYEKLKKAVEEILQIKGLTMEQATAKGYDYVKFLRGLEMLQKSDRCINDIRDKYGMTISKGVLWEYEDKNNDEYYFYNAAKWGGSGRGMAFENLLGKDLSGESGELRKEWRKARQESHSKGVWMEMSGESVFK